MDLDLGDPFHITTPMSFQWPRFQRALSDIDRVESCFSDKAVSFLLDISVEKVDGYVAMGLIPKSHTIEVVGDADLQFSNYWDILQACVFRALERCGVPPSHAHDICRDLIDEASNQYDIEFDGFNTIDFITEYFISATRISHCSDCTTEGYSSREAWLASVVNASLRAFHQRLLNMICPPVVPRS